MKKAVVFTLGCKVNDCESGSLMQGLSELGYEVTDELVPADLYILNTCAVTGEAEKKSRQCVARVQKLNPAARVIVCGCASQRDPHAFAEKPNVTLVSGARQKGRILSLLQEEGVNIDDGDKAYDELLPAKNLKTRASRSRTGATISVPIASFRICAAGAVPAPLRARRRKFSARTRWKRSSRASTFPLTATGNTISPI